MCDKLLTVDHYIRRSTEDNNYHFYDKEYDKFDEIVNYCPFCGESLK